MKGVHNRIDLRHLMLIAFNHRPVDNILNGFLDVDTAQHIFILQTSLGTDQSVFAGQSQ